MANNDQILVVPAASDQSEGARGLLSGIAAPVNLNIDTLRANFTRFMESVNTLLAGIPAVAEPYHLDEIELTLEVNGEGSIQLIGGVKAGASGGITLRMKK